MPILIEAERLLQYKANGISELTEWQKGWNDAIDTIVFETQTAYAEPTMWAMDNESHRSLTFPKENETLVRHGHWINKGYYAICSECGANSGTQYDGLEPIPYYSNFCPNCGAKMNEVGE